MWDEEREEAENIRRDTRNDLMNYGKRVKCIKCGALFLTGDGVYYRASEVCPHCEGWGWDSLFYQS